MSDIFSPGSGDNPVTSRSGWKTGGFTLALTLAVLFAIYGAWWSIAATQVKLGLDLVLGQLAAQGGEYGYGTVRKAGFPFSVRVEVASPFIKSRRWEWRVEKLNVSAKPWSIEQINLDLSGNHEGVAVLGGHVETYTFVAERLKSKFTIDDEISNPRNKLISGPKRVRLQALESQGAGLSLRLLGRRQTFSLGDFNLEMDQGRKDIMDWGVRLRDLRIPQEIRAPLGPRLQHLDIKGQLVGELSGESLITALSSWRDRGGKLNVKMLDASYPPLRITGTGSLTLDSDLQPAGEITTRSRGVMETVDALVHAGLIRNLDSVATKLALMAFSKTPDGGGERYLDLPLTLESHTLFAGPFKILRLRPIQW